uniref:Secreted protein n=1 Tax=Ascaris lumbricoides TaxID=6252 RepID=A0A0M3IMZ7_ASCLU
MALSVFGCNGNPSFLLKSAVFLSVITLECGLFKSVSIVVEFVIYGRLPNVEGRSEAGDVDEGVSKGSLLN